MGITVKRAYDDPESSDGFRVLVDRLWPRGLSKERADIDQWLKEIGPSSELRKWFGHDPARFDDFEKRYRTELEQNDAVDELRSLIAKHKTITLVYSAKDTQHNQAVALERFLRSN